MARLPTPAHSLYLAAILAVDLALRLYRIGYSSYWGDEAFTVYWIRLSLGVLWTEGLTIETTPALYYSLLKGWRAFTGSDSEDAIRLFSALASTATILLVFLTGRRLAGSAAGLIAAALFAVTPLQIYYAQEARAYALLPPLFCGALIGVLEFAKAAEARAAGRQAPALALYAVCGVLLVYCHTTSVVTLAALNLCCLAYLALVRAGQGAVLRLIAANAVVALIGVPQVWAMWNQIGRHDLAFIKPPGLVQLLNVANVLLVDPSTPLTLFRISCLMSAATAASLLLLLLRARLGRLCWLVLVGTPAVFLVTAVLVSFKVPFLEPRITVWISVPICLLWALALCSARPAWLRAVVAVPLALSIGVGLYGVYVRTASAKQDWRGLMAGIREKVISSDGLVALGPNASLLAAIFYGAPERKMVQWWPASIPPRLPLWAEQSPQMRVQLPTPITTEDLARQVREGRRVWLILNARDWDSYGPEAVSAAPSRPTIDRSRAMLVLLVW